jgi:tRNA pseudouridine38-40 synthase
VKGYHDGHLMMHFRAPFLCLSPRDIVRIALRFSYDGRFSGYARQPEGNTVEDYLLKALVREGLVAGSWRTGSRTDKGVHAKINVAAATLQRPHLRGLVPALQAHLPPGIWITGAAEVDEGFDPRRAAWREYTYVASNQGESEEAMVAACREFEGIHNIGAFARIEPHRSPERTIMSMTVTAADGWVFTVRGQSFLWHQVRRMVDAVLGVGAGTTSLDAITQGLRSGKRHSTWDIAPAEGLLLHDIGYAPELIWNPAAGTPPRRIIARQWQQARVAMALMDTLQVDA